MMSVGLVDIPCIDNVWTEVSLLIEEHGQDWLQVVSLESIYKNLKMDALDLWVGYDKFDIHLAMICGWEPHAKAKFYHVLWMGGKDIRPALKEGMHKVEKYACFQGAKEIRFQGREGWEKLLTPLGYGKVPQIEMRKN